MIDEIKQVIEGYLGNRKMTSLMAGTYTSGAVEINEKLRIPMALVTGNLKALLREGDRVKLLRNEGGREYYLVEIIGVLPKLTGRG